MINYIIHRINKTQTLHTPAFPFSRKPFPAGVLVVVSTPLYSSFFLVTPPCSRIWQVRPGCGSGAAHPAFSLYVPSKCSSQERLHPMFSSSIGKQGCGSGAAHPAFSLYYSSNCSSQERLHPAYNQNNDSLHK